MRTYIGHAPEGYPDGVTVQTRDGKPEPLRRRQDLKAYPPAAPFVWGYDHPGVRALSLALLADALEDDAQAVFLHESFGAIIKSWISSRGWQITQRDVVFLAEGVKNSLLGESGKNIAPPPVREQRKRRSRKDKS